MRLEGLLYPIGRCIISTGGQTRILMKLNYSKPHRNTLNHMVTH